MNAFGYLLRRELWEHRALYVVPAVVSALIVLGALFARLHVDAEVPVEEVHMLLRYSPVGLVGIFTGIMMIVAFFYLLDALYADRKDRSVLFWKSMPVSDTRTVLSKLAIAMLVVPGIILVSAAVTELGTLIAASVRLALGGRSPSPLWSGIAVWDSLVVALYGLVVQVLWYFPLYAYLLLASAWARRAVFLWATLTPVAIIIAENQLFDTAHFADLLGHRLVGVFQEHMVLGEHRVHTDLELTDIVNPGRFVADPGLYLGLVAGGVLVAAAIWLRRYRDET